jgi:DNA-binding response OmpR family regulator
MTARIIVVDDEADLREAVVEYLRGEGFDASGADSGVALDARLAERPAALVVLDVNMPGEDGFSIARRLRVGTDIAIVMLTSRGDVVDRIVGLELGADDYLAKPFAMRELLARIRTVLRRTTARPATLEPPAPEQSHAECVWVDIGERRLRIDLAAVFLIEAARDYVVLNTAQGNFVLRHTMKALEPKLDPALFLRVHRSILVQPKAVVELTTVRRSLLATLRSGKRIPIAADRRRALMARMTRS